MCQQQSNSVCPHPIAHLRHIFEVSQDISFMPGKQLVALGDQWWGEFSHACGSSHRLNTEMIAAHMVQYDHIKWRGGRPFLHEPAHMEARRIGSSMNNLMNSPWI